jgi:hypothetical protein
MRPISPRRCNGRVAFIGVNRVVRRILLTHGIGPFLFGGGRFGGRDGRRRISLNGLGQRRRDRLDEASIDTAQANLTEGQQSLDDAHSAVR